MDSLATFRMMQPGSTLSAEITVTGGVRYGEEELTD